MQEWDRTENSVMVCLVSPFFASSWLAFLENIKLCVTCVKFVHSARDLSGAWSHGHTQTC